LFHNVRCLSEIYYKLRIYYIFGVEKMEKILTKKVNIKKGLWKKTLCYLLVTLFVLPSLVVNADGNKDKPDLSVEIIGYSPQNPRDGETVTILANVKNVGNYDAGDFFVNFSCDSLKNIYGTKILSPLCKDASVNISIKWQATAGNHTLMILVDSNNHVEELDENNNMGEIVIYAKGNNTWGTETSDEQDSGSYMDGASFGGTENGMVMVGGSWFTGWSYRKNITILNSKVDGSSSFSNYPILIYIDNAETDFWNHCNSPENIIFTQSDGLTELDREIEIFDHSNDKLYAFVRIPSLSALVNTSIYIYYDSSSPTHGETNDLGTWNTNFKAVWHLNDDPTGAIYDSTPNDNDGSGNNMASNDLIDGKVGKALDFDGTNDYANFADSSSLKPTEVTLLSWIYPRETDPDSRWFVGKGCKDKWQNQDAVSYGVDCRDRDDDSNTEIHTRPENNSNQQTMVDFEITSIHTWYYVGMTYNSSSELVTLYVDGDNKGNKSHGQALRYNNAWDFTIAGSHAGTGSGVNRYENCKIDEVWVLNTDVSDDWISTQYNFQNNPGNCITIGNEEGNNLDSDGDGWTDEEENNTYYTDPYDNDTDNDGILDPQDTDPLIDLKVTLKIKRINASQYTYTWREGESWNRSHNSEGWSKRIPINLSVSSGSTPQDYQVLINISHQAGMNSSFNDLRFISYNDNTTELDYWIERKSDGDWANIWIEFSDSIDTGNKTRAWLYFGNPNATSVSNGTQTFLFFNDFTSDSLTGTASSDPLEKYEDFTEISNIAFEAQSKIYAVSGHANTTQWSYADPIYLRDDSTNDYAIGRFYSRSTPTDYFTGLGVYDNGVMQGFSWNGYRYTDGNYYTISLTFEPGTGFKYRIYNYSSDTVLNTETVSTTMGFYPDQYRIRARNSGTHDDAYITYSSSGDYYEISGDYNMEEVKERIYFILIKKLHSAEPIYYIGTVENYSEQASSWWGTPWYNDLYNSQASDGYYTRQQDQSGIGDWAEWDFYVEKSGVYYIWMRSHRNESTTSNMSLLWDGDPIYDRGSDFGEGFEICWFQNTTDEWKWSWYGLVEVSDSESNSEHTLKIENGLEAGYPDDTRPGEPENYMEVDNILITNDPYCVPFGKGTESSTDYTISADNQGFDTNSKPDFYIKTSINGTTNQSKTWWNTSNVLEDWTAIVDVPDNVIEIPIIIELWDNDTDERESDQLCDISINDDINDDKKCEITYNLRNGTWFGDDHIIDTDFIGRTCGEVDGEWEYNANLWFEIKQNDYDNDYITYWQEVLGPYDGSISPKVKNDRYAVMVAGGASCKLTQTSNIGNTTSSPWFGTYFLYDGYENTSYNWSNYTFYVDLWTNDLDLDGYNEDIGAMFRYQDENNYYWLRWEQNGVNDKMYLWKLVNGVKNTVAGPINVNLKKATWYTMRINLSGTNIKVFTLENGNGTTWTQVFNVTDNSFSSGSIALFIWKNSNARFDDILAEHNGDILLSEGFDYGKTYGWTIVDDVPGESSDWDLTERSIDQEEFYQGPDFVYRVLRIASHYDEGNIHYLSASKWRDADGEGINDVDCLSTKWNIKYEIEEWLNQTSDSNDLNLIYIFDHGYYSGGKSNFRIDTDRDGSCYTPLSGDIIWDSDIDNWLPYYGDNGINRLTFIIEACYIGHFVDQLSKADEDRIIIVTSEYDNIAEPETGQDWGAFHFPLFKKMASGEVDFATAFNNADYHVDQENFFSIWIPVFYGDSPSQNGKLDDNGDGTGSDYNIPNNSEWHDVYEGSYADSQWVEKTITGKCHVTKARVRFYVNRWPLYPVITDFYEFDFYNGSWISPTGHNDPEDAWDNETRAYDDNTTTNASCIREESGWDWTPFIELTLEEPLECEKIRFYAWYNALHCNKIDVDVYYSDGYLAGRTGL